MSQPASVLKLATTPTSGPRPKRPWLKFYPQDWRGDERLGMCSMAARGCLAEFMCLMHTADPSGYLLVNGTAPTDKELARLVRAAGVTELRHLRDELVERGVLSKTADGVLYSRKMVRAALRSRVAHETGRQGGNPALTGKPLTPPLRVGDKLQIPEARNQNPLPPEGELVRESSPQSEEALSSEFLQRYPEIYASCRSGAVYRTSHANFERDYEYAKALARGWPDLRRLTAMLEVFLKRNDFNAKNIPGTPGQFLHMAPDCDRLLREYGR